MVIRGSKEWDVGAVESMEYSGSINRVQFKIICNTVQCNTAQHNITQYITGQYIMTQFTTM